MSCTKSSTRRLVEQKIWAIIYACCYFLYSAFQTVIKELNRLGMIIDLSHSSHKTALDAIQTSDAPVIFSHSSAFALCNSTRNVHDDTLKLLVSMAHLKSNVDF